ncbi:MAG: CBS domain-containing protein [Candidatus Korobacteraceae bacterium]|jgi:sporulation protein YlmC with PRC-barrel domain/CBS domain-containing protein
MPSLALSELIGAPAIDNTGTRAGKVREVTLAPQENSNLVVGFVIKTQHGDRLVPASAVSLINHGLHISTPADEWIPYGGGEGLLLLERDLLDQQIIDVHGRKVVRVNDVDIHEESGDGHIILKIGAVDVGARGAMRRLLKGVVPAAALHLLLEKIPPRMIPWEFVDLIEIDPARRVKLKISLARLAQLHPADIADIVEDLAPAEREAIFETLDDGVAAETLEEIDPKMQVSILSSLDSDRAADIVEEMDPDAAADLLGDMHPDDSQEILTEMEPAERAEVTELMTFHDNTAAGRMTTDYMALTAGAKVEDAVEMLRNFEGGVESVSTIFIIGEKDKLLGAVPLAKIVLAPPGTPLMMLSTGHMATIHPGADEKSIAELFDKYNLLTLPVIDEDGVLTGVITADDVINMLRAKL